MVEIPEDFHDRVMAALKNALKYRISIKQQIFYKEKVNGRWTLS